MRKKNYWKNRHGYLFYCAMMLMLTTLCTTSCKDEDDQTEGVFDPNKPVTITGFTPETLGGGADMVLYGDNFGNDISRVKVTLGGKDAKVIGVNNNSLYCLMPMGAFDGNIQVSILDESGTTVAIAESEKKYTYEKQWLVSTAVGTYYETGSDEEEKEGPAEDCGCFRDIIWFSWDPKSNFDHLYLISEYSACRLIDFSVDNGPGKKDGYVYYFKPADKFDRISVITWTADENQDMILTHNHSSDSKIGNYLLTRASGFQNSQPLGTYARGVNGTMVHPETGDLFYTRYRAGDFCKYSFETGETTSEFSFAVSPESYRLIMHPSGKYAYILAKEHDFIMRTDYNEITKTFNTPYTVAGRSGSGGYKDAMGGFARLDNPNQGCFVRNESYIGTRPDGDEYDFYFCDTNNHCIRILNPDGRVKTFAGRAKGQSTGYQNGEVREDALFRSPTAIAYDEKRNCFYIGESGSKVIRKIAEEAEEKDETSDETQESENQNNNK